ncbi:MAG: hypothetical protein BGO55_09115 [Sphingobacteriales bacterium 50-39]|nr:hypothetical protein [Sphingobacteriales bacterium]OJW57705.1 MAG: hypothetical protein BGO55_09115 [Sphingobacteriales bacterium 50-39]
MPLPIRLTFLLLTIYGTSLHAQTLKADELAVLKKYKLEKIDSFMTAKGFKKQVFSDEKDFSITNYTVITRTDSGAAQRSLHVGWVPKIKVLTLEYGLWLKSEAASFSKQLTQAGYKRSVSSTPNIDGSSFQTTSYKKGLISIGYKEVQQDSGTVYIFSIEDDR